MIRKLMASSAIIALMTAGTAVAQTQPDPAMDQNQPAMQQPATGADAQMQAEPPLEVGESNPTLQPDEPTLATAFIGKSVYSSQDPEADNIGNVNDLIVSDDGTITHAVVGVGGFLGIGEKNVAVPFEELQVAEREGDLRLIYAATREDLEAAQEFDRTAYDPEARNQEQQQAAGGMTTAPQTGMAANDAEPMATEPMETAEMETAEQNLEAAGNEVEQNVDAAGDEAEQEMAEAEAEMESAEPMDETAEAPAAPGGEQVAEATLSDTQGTEGFVSYDAAALRASTLMGREIYGEGDESIGEVSDLVLQPDGGTRAALIDVGGFLGVGEKEVAIPFSEIQVQQGQEGEEPRLTVAMTREQLEQEPAYERPEMADATATAPATGEAPMATDQAPVVEGEVAEGEVVETDQMATTGQAGMEGGMMAASQDLSADELLGQAVYGENDDSVGDIGDLVFTPEGDIEAVVIDVGGFLGIGEKPVAVQYDTLNIRNDGTGEARIMINATEEQLENAPAYDDETSTVQ